MTVPSFKIGHFEIGPEHPPFIVAEMSGNHNQSLDRALAIVDAAAKAGVQGLKIQTYTADTMTLDINRDEFRIDDPKSLWKGKSLYQLYQEAYTPWEWHEAIFKRCREHGLVGFSTPFDFSAVDFLENLDSPCYKIASFENIDIPLIKKVAATGKPVIISTGMALIAELDDAVKAIRSEGNERIVLLKCTSSYPATPENSHILTIPHMRDLFGVQVGLSDHTLGTGTSVAAVALGAIFVEKHFTLNRAEGGVDSAFSLEPSEMKALVEETRRAWQSLGRITYGPTEKETASLKHRRSLYFVQDMKAGDIITDQNMRSIRPGLGLPPKYYEILLGKKIIRDIKRGTPVGWEMIE